MRGRIVDPLGLGLIVVAAAVVGIVIPRAIDARHAHGDTLAAWLVILVLLAAFLVVAGRWVTGFWRGAFIDERNRISLARFQTVLWTMLVLSAYFAGVLVNTGHRSANPFSISIPKELWLAMGISVASLVSSPLIQVLAGKNEPKPDPAGRRRQPEERTAIGQLDARASPADASWKDLVAGEETGNAHQLDLTRVQMLLFTVVLVVGYGIAVGDLFASHYSIHDFPRLDSAFVILLALSQTGYLARKAVPQTTTKPTPESGLADGEGAVAGPTIR